MIKKKIDYMQQKNTCRLDENWDEIIKHTIGVHYKL